MINFNRIETTRNFKIFHKCLSRIQQVMILGPGRFHGIRGIGGIRRKL